MWLLSTDRAELHHFASPKDVPGGYAILSHVWNTDGPEQSFQDTERLAATLKGPAKCPRDDASQKVKECCILAEKHGFRWLWIDTCCIDKKSSTELSEAINSMFRYYQLARICYVYLYDVVDPPHPRDRMTHPRDKDETLYGFTSISDFWRSKWHTRGWTLQELLASEFVAFFSRDWRLLGSKTDLSGLLEKITRIPQPVLMLETPLSTVSVSERMGWAAKRETTRSEDEAYCLLGIFDINMPLLYGEGGPKAFLRLQEEIMKQSRDTTLFSWVPGPSLDRQTLSLSHALSSVLPNDSSGIQTDSGHTHNADDVAIYLFARSPAHFASLSYMSMRFDLSHFEEVRQAVRSQEFIGSPGPDTRPADLPTFSITPYGVLAHVPVIELQGAQTLIAVLGWTATSDGRRYGLLLTRCPNPAELSYNLYDIGIKGQRLVEIEAVPGSGFPNDFDERLHAPYWMDVYLLQRPPQDNISGTVRTGTTSLPLAVLTTGLTSPFRFMRRDLVDLQEGINEGLENSLIKLHSISYKTLSVPWTGFGPPMTFTFIITKHSTLDTHGHDLAQHSTSLPPKDPMDTKDVGYSRHFQAEEVVLQIGLCSTSSASRHGLASHWAKIRLVPAHIDSASSSGVEGSETSAHDCSVDHVYGWPNLKKEAAIVLPRSVGVYEYCLMKLSFSPCSINPMALIGDIVIIPISVFPRQLFPGSPQEAAAERRRVIRRKLSVFAEEICGRSAFEVIPNEFSPEAGPLTHEPSLRAPTPVKVSWLQVDHQSHSWIQHEFEDPDWMTSSEFDGDSRA